MLQNDFVSDSDDGEIDSTACDDQHRHEEHGQVNSQCGIRDNGKIVGITSTSKCNKCFLQSDLKAGEERTHEAQLGVFVTCGSSMLQFAANKRDLVNNSKGFLEEIPDTDDFGDDKTDAAHMHVVTSFIRSASFWDEMLTFQNDAHQQAAGSTTPLYEGIDASGLQDLLSVFDEFSSEIDVLAECLNADTEVVIDHPAAAQADEVSKARITPSSSSSALLSDPAPSPLHGEERDQSDAEKQLRVSSEELVVEDEPSIPAPAVEPATPALSSTPPKQQQQHEYEHVSKEFLKKGAVPATSAEGAAAASAAAALETVKIRPGSVWDDLDVAAMKNVKQVTLEAANPSSSCIDAYDHSEEGAALRILALQLGSQASRPVDLSQLLTVAAIGSALVASSVWVAMHHGEQQHDDSTHRLSPSRLLSVLWAAAFALNIAAVSLPGRLDRMYAEKVHLKPWQSLFEPSNWAFAIWAVIYAVEALGTLGVLVLLSAAPNGVLAAAMAQALPYWVAGNAAQTMWCFVFRPAFSGSLHVPTWCLTVAAAAYGVAHWKVSGTLLTLATEASADASTSLPSTERLVMWLLRGALSTHCMWLIVSAVVTLNSWLTVSYAARARGLQTTAGFCSAFVVASAGIALSVYSLDPMYAATTAWAMCALSQRAQHKATMVPTAGDKRFVSLDVHESLASVESLLGGAAQCIAVGVVLVPFTSALYSGFV